ncbi:type IV secretory system conjugative DNA transfer family protein [Catenulispora rubra]|uniref:type IV secretory system conjugative DNA transfer family protein n=1 Tax=Catenulispora rubra TaxID=280293 RepID=UPI0018927322|nr:type IV secretion system DNA-binding domain-containing protein [Catenulispora rubra]
MTTATPSSVPPPGPQPSSGLVGRLIAHPGAEFALLGRIAAHAGLSYGLLWGPPILTAVALALYLRSRHRRAVHERFTADARLITVMAPPRVESDGAAALWSHLLGLLRPARRRLLSGQPHLAFEYGWTRAGLRISIWVPGVVPPGMIERAIASAWPGAATDTQPAAASLLLPPDASATGGRLRLARTELLPIATGHDADPLRPLLGACAGLSGQEHTAVQILARPVTGRRTRRARRQLTALRTGRAANPVSRILDEFTPGAGAGRRAPARTPGVPADPTKAAELRAASAKIAGGLWDVRVLYVAASTGAGETDRSPRLRGRAHAIASAFSMFAGSNWFARKKLANPVGVVNSRRFSGRGSLLGVGELAAIAHLPTDAAAPGVERAGARAATPPPGILTPTGPEAGEGVAPVKPLGISESANPRPVGLAVADARQHVHILGATGSGKSTLMTHMILDDVAARRGVVVIDPKGDLITDILVRLPESALGRTVVFDPDDASAPPSLNVLQLERPDEVDMIVDNLCGLFGRIFSSFWGPRTDDNLRSACLTLLHSPEAATGGVSLADIPRLLGEDAYRRRMTAGLKDPVLRGFWNQYEGLSEAQRANHVGPLMNKLRAFLLRSFVRDSIADGPSSFDMEKVLDGGVLLVRLPKGVIGEETAKLLGSFVVAKVWQAASRRAKLPQHQRRDCALYLDEFQNFLNLPYPMEDMLAEARGYKLSLTLAHQNLAQLPNDLREGISANARTKLFFNASPEDSRLLERHTTPILLAHDLSHLGAFQAAARLVTGSQQRPAFTLRTKPLPAAIAGRDNQVRRSAREMFGHAPGETRRPGTAGLNRRPGRTAGAARQDPGPAHQSSDTLNAAGQDNETPPTAR